jgi:hypothetical protein
MFSGRHSYIDDNTELHNVTTEKQISDYMSYLFKFLGKYCFIKGSFVIADNNSQLYNFLNYADKRISTKPLSETHTIYKNDPNESLKEIELTHYPFVINCKSDENCKLSRECKVIKWYRFFENGNSFIFIKPEREPSRTFTHNLNAFQRYALKINTPDCLQHRREDCYRESNCDNTDNYLPYRMFPSVIINETEYEVVETYSRRGDEAFIIEPVSEFIIYAVTNKTGINFSYDNFNDVMTLTSTINGGNFKKKYKTLKKNKRNKKTKRIKNKHNKKTNTIKKRTQ